MNKSKQLLNISNHILYFYPCAKWSSYVRTCIEPVWIRKHTIISGDHEAVDKIKKFYGARSEDGFYYCNICGFAEKHTSNIRSHVESKHYSPGYPCSICGKVFKLRNSIRSHHKICYAKNTQVYNLERQE